MAEMESAPIDLVNFLESTPPGRLINIADIAGYEGYESQSGPYLKKPDIKLHCDNAACQGLRFFTCIERTRGELSQEAFTNVFLKYRCRNCQNTEKVFALSVCLNETGRGGEIVKVGEWPPFGTPTPARVIKLIGPDRELYLMGRRAENQGMGIGAFSYYRRVVENQKNRILEEIARVSEKMKASPELVERLRSAQKETQFRKAMESVKDAVPAALRIEGNNPLTLLYSALSQGIHAKTDQECLESATSIRVILTELADRSGQILKDEEELSKAVSRLLQPKSNHKTVESSDS